MAAKFEWTNDTGLRHPSLVCVKDHGDDSVPIKEMPILHTRQIENLCDVLTLRYDLNRRKLPKIAGWRPQWYDCRIETSRGYKNPWYAIVVGYVRLVKEVPG